MLQNVKKLVSAFLSLAMVFSILLAPTSLLAASTSWNFKTTNFKDLGKISSSKTVDNLGLIATSSKKMSVTKNSQTLDGTEYTYCLALGGTGAISHRAVKVPVNGASTIKVTLMSSSSSSRKLVIADQKGSQLTTLAADKKISMKSYNYTGSKGYIYLYSANSGINIFKIQVDDNSNSSSDSNSNSGSNSGSNSDSNTGSNSGSSSDSNSGSNSDSNSDSTPSNAIIVTNGGTSLSSALSKAKSGTTIIVRGTVKSGTVNLPAGITLKGENNATIDFSQTSGSSGRGIIINTNGSTLKDLKIINAADNGIFISGKNNTLHNVETAYNKDTGIQVSDGGAYNKFYNCYSHHNADSKGENADGFAVKLHSGEGNYFEGCIAEYNSDDGWDLYAAHGAVTFVNCQANYNGECNGIKGDGNGFKLGGVDNKTPGTAAHLDPLPHKLTDCSAKGNLKNGFDRNNQNGVVTMIRCTGDSNKGKNFNWPLTGKPSALGYSVTFGKAILNNCTSIKGSNNITGATLSNCTGF